MLFRSSVTALIAATITARQECNGLSGVAKAKPNVSPIKKNRKKCAAFRIINPALVRFALLSSTCIRCSTKRAICPLSWPDSSPVCDEKNHIAPINTSPAIPQHMRNNVYRLFILYLQCYSIPYGIETLSEMSDKPAF